ncbi:hypothetical protein ACE6H2_017323 [Prunus campanulata]
MGWGISWGLRFGVGYQLGWLGKDGFVGGGCVRVGVLELCDLELCGLGLVDECAGGDWVEVVGGCAMVGLVRGEWLWGWGGFRGLRKMGDGDCWSRLIW